MIEPKAFLSKFNLQSMAFQVPEFGILALGMMVTIITGGIDLSIIANANLSGIFASLVMYKYLETAGNNPSSFLIMVIIILICMISGLLMGCFNGLLISRLRIPAILATLGTMKLFDGISTVITGGQSLRNYPVVVAKLANESFLGIPISFYIFIFITFLMWVLMGKTKLGYTIYMYGENPLASKFSGLDNKATLLKTYCISGVLAGLSGLIMMSRFNSIKVGYGNSYQLLTVLVAIMGGVNPNGGKGKILCVAFSVLTLQCIASGFNILGFTNYVRNIIFGTVLIVVMMINFLYPLISSKTVFKKQKKAIAFV
ncbi:ABC transporter permease [uncultured Sphaerochaeta sp.]|uniref:ABC transporter permease n=1 Tax=uncultured Sphaerochaeta sp. TaxID=886478 RepID=UPI002A0A6269|nr:ABC transporter permease [uncultured Sphaerochaeta sp.]